MEDIIEENKLGDNKWVKLIFTREKRNQLLKESDKYVLCDYPITPENLELIKEYRQNLRNYMKTAEEIFNNTGEIPDFPELPQF